MKKHGQKCFAFSFCTLFEPQSNVPMLDRFSKCATSMKCFVCLSGENKEIVHGNIDERCLPYL